MFTGIVTAIGTVTACQRLGDLRLTIACPYDPATIALGASIACSGVCLTVVRRGDDGGGSGHASGWFSVDVSDETLARTAPRRWREGAQLNLEQALRLGDEIGGHIVTGHVDAVGEVVSASELGGSTRLDVRAPPALAPYLAEKGSITIDGVSLTVNAVADEPDASALVSLNIIPHTASVTTLGALAAGDPVNLEIDVLARYLRRMEALRAA
jgi:riboflavin synthase